MRAEAVRAAAVATMAWLPAAPALAHDFWIEPGSFAPLPGEAVAVRLRVGEHFDGEPVPRPSALRRFVVADLRSGASAALPGRLGARGSASRCAATRRAASSCRWTAPGTGS